MHLLQIFSYMLMYLVLFMPGMAISEGNNTAKFDTTLNEARSLLRQAVWNNQYNDSLRKSVDLTLAAQDLAKANWGERDDRFLQAISVHAIAMSQHTLGIISRSDGNVAKSVKLVESLTTEAGSIARTQTQDGELLMMATLIKARLARLTNKPEKAMQLYGFVVQTLESMMAADHPILIAVKAERGKT